MCWSSGCFLALFRNQISDAFGATGAARELIAFYCLFVAGSFLFNGMLFVANAAFNNLGFPLYSTISNWGRSTLGVIPFVSLGASWYGATGALAGSGLGAVLFGLGAAIVCFRVIKDLERRNPPEAAAPCRLRRTRRFPPARRRRWVSRTSPWPSRRLPHRWRVSARP